MSDSANTPGPRRSQRDRKVAKPFVSGSTTSSGRKRKRPDTDTENEDVAVTDVEKAREDEPEDADMEEEEDQPEYRAPKPKTTKKGKATASTKTRAATAPKKPREPKNTTRNAPKVTARRGRKPKEGEDVYDADQVTKDTKIASDNPLFNAIMNPAAALQSTAEDFLESLEHSPGPAQAELINLFLRSCGCNDTVTADEALDYDGVLDNLDNITETLKQDNSPVYPLTSKLAIFKKFRKSLSEFIERLITSSAELGSLYSTDLMATLQTWVVAMSSSQIRSFRHTATVVALEVETSLCEVAAAVEKEAQLVGRQREGEKKRKAGAKGGAARDKELQGKAQEIRERRKNLAEFLKEFVDGVFIHRYRDLDPNIRSECVKAIGLWFKKYPGHFLDGAYLRYVGWVLSDANTHVRLEAVKALSGVYEQNDYIGSLNHFTERFKPRLLEMATSDTELSVRVAVIQVLGAIDGHSLLDEEERDNLCLLIYDEEAKVRKAVSQFVHNVWEESLEERLVGKRKPTDVDQTRAGIKALASLLVKWSKALDAVTGDAEESENGDARAADDESSNGTSRHARRKEILALVGSTDQRGRTALAIEALWEDVPCVREWEEILNILLLDHSASGADNDSQPAPRIRPNGTAHDTDSTVDDAWRLEEVEETVLLEVLVASLRRVKFEATAAKKATDEENVLNDITRALIKALPRLFIKYQADQNRIAEVLLTPSLLNLELYLEMRMITAYSNLWDDVIKQFMSHSSVTVLSHAMNAISCFMATTSLSNTNSTKILELEDELSSSLRDTVAGRDEIEVASFTEDEVLALTAISTRLAVLAGSRNMSAWIDEDEGGKQSSAWNIFSALADRGRLGYKEEEGMIEQTLNTLTLHILWKAKGLLVNKDSGGEETRYHELFVEQRDTLVDKLKEFAVGTQSNTSEGVKRAAFKHLLNIHILFAPEQAPLPDGSPSPLANFSLSLDDELQYRCAGYIQAEIERYADYLDDNDLGEESNAGSDNEEGSDNAESDKKSKPKRRVTKNQGNGPSHSQQLIEREYLFVDVITTFLRAIRIGAISLKHGAIFLAHYGRLGASVDACSKVIADMLKEEGMSKENGEIVVEIATKALQEAYSLVFDGIVHDETEAVQLSKLLSQCFVLRGSQLSILRRLNPDHIVHIHTNLLNWIVKRLTVYENNKNKKLKKTALLFFRVLVPLVTGIQSGDALKIKAHMDQLLEQSKIEVSPLSKDWEPQRAYAKRVDAVMTKEKGGTKGRRAGKGKKNGPGALTDEEESEGEKAVEEPVADRPRPKPKRVTRSNPIIEPEENGDPTTPKSRVRPNSVHGPTTQADADADLVDDTAPQPSPHPEVDAEASDAEMPNEVTPKSSLKRRRPTDDDGDDGGSGAENSGGVETTPVTEMQVRRKRIRH